jgi:dCTP deaminase
MIEPYEAGQVRAIKPSLGEFDVDKQLDYIYEIVDWVKKMTGFDVMDKLHGHRNSIVRINELMKLNHTQMDQLQLSLDRIGPQAKNTFRREDGMYRTVQEFIDHVWDNVIPQDYFEDNITDYKKIVSYGTSSYGYDVRCADEFKIFTNVNSAIIDPKNFNQKSFVEFKGKECIIPPNSFALARTVEYFRIPRDVITICLGKSTYARCGIIVNVTPFEPEWEGYVTLEFSNTTPLPAKIYANEGCAQVLFLQGNQPPLTSYKDRNGKYQGQSGVVTPRM